MMQYPMVIKRNGNEQSEPKTVSQQRWFAKALAWVCFRQVPALWYWCVWLGSPDTCVHSLIKSMVSDSGFSGTKESEMLGLVVY